MNKTLLRVVLPVLALATLLAFMLALSPLSTGSAHNPTGAQLHAQGPTPTPTPQDKSQPGSTDGLFIMSMTIAAIIVLPLLLHGALRMH